VTTGLEIEQFEPSLASDSAFASYHRVVVASQAADRPEEPRLPLQELIGRLTSPFPGARAVAHWVAALDGEVVAVAEVDFLDEENHDIAIAEIHVHPANRRRGIGTALLRALLPELKSQECRVVESWRVVSGTAGEHWAEHMGFRTVRAIARQMLVLPEIDRSLWEVEVPPGYRLLRWVGTTPDDVVESYAAARDAIHDAPLGQSEYQWPRWTVERLRATEAEWRSQGLEQRVVAAVHENTGAVVAFTELCVHARRPDWGYQRDTAVVAGHRGHGLGRCVKAHMAAWLSDACPALERVSTTTGTDNQHMIRVNLGVGYTTLRTMIAVRETSADLIAVLARQGASDGGR
jgi:mycothiol synthase